MSTAGTPPQGRTRRPAPADVAASVPGAREAVADVNHGIVSQDDNAVDLVSQEDG
ncbi:MULTISPECIES: hypothetical protein [unclassified Streptomyces]|uniref:hypothetical protein n=1 Tax=unclassified Streptomyces TaxID=2593676 RepID=UPI00382253FF